MNSNKPWIWIALFTGLNIVTALLTELYNDEAYYWAYSRFLDWGYFDHPPVIALLIKIGYAIIPNELGVRLLSLLLVSAALYMCFHLAGTKDVKLFALLLFSVFPLFLFGITALPDSPMLFAVAIFFWAYQQFLKDESWTWTLVLAVSMAFMLYTKYMGVLVILFTLASNISLLKRKWFWLASIIGAALFLPHLYWQYANDFPSVKYHLVDRSAKAYQVAFTLEYLGGQLLFYGPFVGVFMYWAAIKKSTADFFDRALKYVVVGTLVFFFLSSFKGRVEVNWTLGMLVPLVILTLRYFQQPSRGRVWLVRMAWLSIPLIVLVRLHVTYPLADFKNDRAKDFHGHKKVVAAFVKEADGLPLVAHRYQTASTFWFYTGKPVPVLNVNTRFSQYDLWQFDSALVNKPALYINRLAVDGTKTIESLSVMRLDSFPVFKFIEPAIARTDNKFLFHVDLGKPASFYAFTKQYPLIFNIEFMDDAGLVLQAATVTLDPYNAQLDRHIDVSQQVYEDAKRVSITLTTNTFGVVRKFPIQVLKSN